MGIGSVLSELAKLILGLTGLKGKPKSEQVQLIKEARRYKRKTQKYYWKTYRKYKRKGFNDQETLVLEELRDGITDLDFIIRDLLKGK